MLEACVTLRTRVGDLRGFIWRKRMRGNVISNEMKVLFCVLCATGAGCVGGDQAAPTTALPGNEGVVSVTEAALGSDDEDKNDFRDRHTNTKPLSKRKDD